MIRPQEGIDASPPQAWRAALQGDDAEVSLDRYTVHLDRFEGPLDLLLYLIQRDEIDIYDIPIAHITREYLQQLELIEALNLDNAGEFLVMAATLMRIKARMLLPVQSDEGDEDEGDPREELVRRLLEYKRYKDAAAKLAQAEDARRRYFRQGQEYPYLDHDEEPPELSLSLFDLLGALRNVLDQLEGDHLHRVYQEVYTVETQMEIILSRLTQAEQVRFQEIFRHATVKMEVVVSFVAMLELMKEQRITGYQLTPYGEIWLKLKDTPRQDAAQDEGGPQKEATDAA